MLYHCTHSDKSYHMLDCIIVKHFKFRFIVKDPTFRFIIVIDDRKAAPGESL